MLWPVIMAGGLGTRFWPESRRTRPKQFLSFFGRQTLIEETLRRLRKTASTKQTIIITQKDKAALAKSLLRKVPSSQIWGEPAGRNTAPCAILAAAYICRRDAEGVLALLPADHHIRDTAGFQNALRMAHRTALGMQCPVTFGIRPTMPHTGYGYLELGKKFSPVSGPEIFWLKRFCEKPDSIAARRYVRSGRYLWNSGIFVWKASALMEAARRWLPSAVQIAEKIVSGNFKQRYEREFKRMPSVSIDYGLMEKLGGRILTIPADFGWSDVGGWMSYAELCSKDSNGNVCGGTVVAMDSRNNLVRTAVGSKKLVALLGVRDMVIVDTRDALLLCSKSQTEEIRKIVGQLKSKRLQRYL